MSPDPPPSSNAKNQASEHQSPEMDQADVEHDPSKSQAKRDAHDIRDLGAALAGLSPAERRRIPLDEDVNAAIDELNRIRPGANGARKRQLGFLAKRLRQVDVEPIQQAVEAIRQTARAAAADLHLVEAWRDRLLGEGPAESPNEALTAFLNEHSAIDRQELRQLQQRALAERKQAKPPAAARKLFRLVRDALAAARVQE